MKVYIDVTNLLAVDFLTGIQRVVREVTVRLLRNARLEVVLLASNHSLDSFQIVDNQKFTDYYMFQKGNRANLLSGKQIRLDEIEAGAVFYDMDSVWGLTMRRSAILPILKQNGVKLAVYIYDIIPLTYPQYCHEETIFNFLSYLGAYLQYADIIIVSTQSTLDQLNQLMEELKLPQIKGYVSWLGSDFKKPADDRKEEVSQDAIEIAEKGKYVLAVGTIEPRKNHKLLLDAYDAKLKDLGINMVFAGRIGWNVEALEKRIKTHPMKNQGLYHLSGKNDATIDYLYRNAFVVAFPTYEEGFGLPIIESFERGAVLVASDIPVLKEVGKDYCDYFDPNDPNEFAKLMERYMKDPALYEQRKNRIKEYVPVTWDEVTVSIEEAIESIELS